MGNKFTYSELTLIRFMAKDTARMGEGKGCPQEFLDDYYSIADKCNEMQEEMEREKN